MSKYKVTFILTFKIFITLLKSAFLSFYTLFQKILFFYHKKKLLFTDLNQK